MSDDPPGDALHADRAELAALRRRAYGADADIDAVGLARLRALEDAVVRDRAGRATGDEAAAAATAAAITEPLEQTPETAPSPQPRTPPWHTASIAATAIVAVLLGGAAWMQSREPGAAAATPPADTEPLSVGDDDTGYELYIDRLRDDVLAVAAASGNAPRLIREQLTPYGAMYGRTVGSGPTRDGQFCMIIDDEPSPAIACISMEEADAYSVSIVLPAGFEDADGGPLASAPLVSYTLLPGGGVVAKPTEGGAPAS